jgi:hypothetical protein
MMKSSSCPKCRCTIPQAIQKLEPGIKFRCRVCSTLLERVPYGIEEAADDGDGRGAEEEYSGSTNVELMKVLSDCSRQIQEANMELLVSPFVDAEAIAKNIRKEIDEALTRSHRRAKKS